MFLIYSLYGTRGNEVWKLSAEEYFEDDDKVKYTNTDVGIF